MKKRTTVGKAAAILVALLVLASCQGSKGFDIQAGTLIKYTGTAVNVKIPSSVTVIGKEAFADLAGMKSVTIPSSVTSIREKAFSNCAGLTSITIPSSVTSIGEMAFLGCTGLTSITIPSSVTSIGSAPFWKCTRLTSITIGAGVSFHYKEIDKLTGLFGVYEGNGAGTYVKIDDSWVKK